MRYNKPSLWEAFQDGFENAVDAKGYFVVRLIVSLIVAAGLFAALVLLGTQ